MSQPLSTPDLQGCTAASLTASPAETVARLIPRPHLRASLLEQPRRLRLLCAPLGYGKTTLVQQCLAQAVPGQLTAQLNFAGQSLSLGRFCARVARQLGYPPERMSTGQTLLDFLEGLDAPFTLVLDHYPAHADAELDAWLEYLLLHSSSAAEVWVSCRQRPKWNLPRLFLDGKLVELDSRALGFSRQESDALVSLSNPVATHHEAVWQQTLGWCAGVRLLLTDSPGSRGSVQDYLEHELRSQLTAVQSRLLHSLAHLPRFSQGLCAMLWEDPEDKLGLSRLLQSQTLLQPLDNSGQWYRLLPAVALALRGQLAGSDLNRLRLRACRELSQCGFIEDAIDLALDAGQVEVAVNYIATLSPSWLLAGRHLQRLHGWQQHIPQILQNVTPPLVVLNTSALLMSARLDEAQACLTHLWRFLPQPDAAGNRRLLAIWQALQGTWLGLSGNDAIAREYCQSALEQLGEDEPHVSFMCTVILARLAMSTGETVQAQQVLMHALEQARRRGSVVREVQINTQRISLMILCGESELAGHLLQENLGLLRAQGDVHPLLLGRLLVLQGKLHLQRGEMELSERVLRQALEQQIDNCLTVLPALIGLCEIHACRGEFQPAFALLHDAERRMQCANVQETSYRGILSLQTLSVLIQQQNWKQALPMAQMIEQYLRGPALRSSSLQIPSLPVHSQLLFALVEQGIGQLNDAARRLQAACRECRRLNFHGLEAKLQRTLDNLGAPPRQPSVKASPTPLAGTFNLLVSEARTPGSRVVAAGAGKSATGSRQETLSGREISVLELLAEGLSNREISERLYISTNTVKAHIKHINSKLGVTRRAQAVMRAKAIGVLA
jgi:ATP/maltotriose-dependent transcriptional regulator MalT